MSNTNPPRRRRSFRVIFKFIKFAVLLSLTFLFSFIITLFMKSEDPADVVGSLGEEIFSEEQPVKSQGVPEIKTLFDEENKRPFDLKTAADKKVSAAEKVPDDKKSSADNPPPARQNKELGLIDTLGRMTSIKPAVDEKIKSIPHYVTLDKMPYLLRQAIVSVEDTRFYTHDGFDPIGIARAVFVNVEAGEIREGASTITQQTVKNLFLTNDKTFTRKLEELVLSLNMERGFDKDKILEIYLNSIYFGSNFYGIYDAAQGYFNKEPAELTLAECAMLAGLPNAPSRYSPYVDFHLAKKRQLVVIDTMEKAGVISKREAESARIAEIILAR